MNGNFWRAAGIVLVLLVASASAADDPLQRYVAIARDGEGATWTIHRGGGAGRPGNTSLDKINTLFRAEAGKAEASAIELPEAFEPKRLLALRDGRMVCLFNDLTDRLPSSLAVFYRQGKAVCQTTLAGAAAAADAPMLERADGSVVIAGYSGAYLVPRGGAGKTVPLAAAHFSPFAAEISPGAPEPLRGIEDGAGRLWFWSNALLPTINRLDGRGLFTIENDKLERSEIAGLAPTSPVSAVLPLDADHAWVAIVDAGLWVVDWRTRRAEPLLPAAGGAVGAGGPSCVSSLFQLGRDRFAVAGSSALAAVEAVYPPQALFRFTGAGWEKEIEQFDDAISRPQQRPTLLTSAGFLVARANHGFWLLDPERRRPPELLDWRRGFPVRSVSDFFAESSSTVRVLGLGGVLHTFSPGRIPPPGASKVQSVSLRTLPVRDAQARLWAVDEGSRLVRWDGAAWEAQPSPPELAQPAAYVVLQPDECNRGWLVAAEGWVAVIDFATGRWQSYSELPAALAAEAGRGLPKARNESGFIHAARAESGELLCRFGAVRVHFFDGQRWQRWSAFQIDGDRAVNFVPYFVDGTQPRFAYGSRIRALDRSTGRWGDPPAEERLPPLEVLAAAGRGPFAGPPDSPIKSKYWAVDEMGALWATDSGGELYKTVRGRTTRIFGPEDENPFRAGEYFSKVVTDREGGAFILANASARKPQPKLAYYYIPPVGDLPDARVQLVQSRGDSARLRVEAGKETWISWKLDELDWLPLQQEKEIILEKLKPGLHRLQVRAYSADLRTRPEPAVVEWKCEFMDAEAMARAIAQLGSRSLEERRAAGVLLRGQGTAALPLLEEARRTGAPDAQFGIEKVIGEIEGDLHTQ